MKDEPKPPLPERIGPYRILERLGEGGMGVVYLAEQTEPVRRQVALKVLRNLVLHDTAALRFDAERQALARLQHPNVAQMYEAGATEDGHLYFAMEPVDGQPIGAYCDEHRLTIHERLELFCAVCHGVQHAHQKGILHRDLKPSNILVTEAHGKPVPKIIDFGVAKALDQPLVDATLYTDDRLVGTPAYLSPEALGTEESDSDVDTRSDVYSLGVVLYELLIGVRPFDTSGLGFLQVLTKVVEEDPEGPSTRWTTLDVETRQAIAQRRRLERKALKHRLRGDLDWIVMKAMAKDRRQRYGSPSELVADIQRHLEHRPVEAGPPSPLYRLGKLVRRHRAIAAAALLVMLAGAKYTLDLKQEQRRTLEALSQAERARNEAQQVSDFLVDVFEVADPGEARGNQITAREILDNGARRLDHELDDQPLTKARLYSTIGVVYEHLGLHQEAATMLEQAVAIRRREQLGHHLDLAADLHFQAEIYHYLDRYDEATELFTESLEMRQRLLPAGHPLIASNLTDLGKIRFEQGRVKEARELLERSVEIRRTALAPDDPMLANSLWALADVLTDLGEYQQAKELFDETIAIFETSLGPDHPTLATALGALGAFLVNQNRFSEAVPYFQRSHDIRERVLGPDHPNLGISASYLGYVAAVEGRFGEGEARLQEALEIFENRLGPNHFNVGANLLLLAELQLRMGHVEDAQATYERSLAIWQHTGLEDSSNGLTAIAGLAEVAMTRRDLAGAERLYRQTLEGWQSSIGADTAEAMGALVGVADCAFRRGRLEEAEDLFRDARDRARRFLERSPGSPDMVAVAARAGLLWGTLESVQGNIPESLMLWQEAYAGVARLPNLDTDITLLPLRAHLLIRLDREEEAQPLLARLSTIGWTPPDLQDLCRQRGLPFPLP